jgi:transmembrane sensor
MSQFQDPRDDDAPFSDIDLRAANYVERRDNGDWTDRDEADFEAWLGESVAHRVAFLRLNASWKRTERLAALRTPEPLPEISREPRSGRSYFKMAAAFGALSALGIVLAIYLGLPRGETYSTPVGGRETLALSDGSRIELNTDTSIRISLSGKERAVSVEKGEVYFSVHHNASWPFVVTAQGHRVVDLGTEFSLRLEPKSVKVALLQGRVRFDPDAQSDAQPKILAPGDVLEASVDRVSVKTESMRDIMASLAWRKGQLIFHNTPLVEAAAELNRYSQIKIVLQDPLAATETINGTLAINDLAEFAHLANSLFGLRVEDRGNEIVLTR